MSNEFAGTASKLAEQDFQDAAQTLSCPVASIRAVVEVEASGSGFFDDGRPKILFESRWFHKLTDGAYDETHPELSTPNWQRNYFGGKREYERLEQAIALNREAALQSASWGMFQILGINYKLCGFSNVEEFVAAQVQSEAAQLRAFVQFVLSKKLDDELRDQRWADFAKIYNGPGYRQNRYDEKLASAFEKHNAAVFTTSTEDIQRELIKRGYAVALTGVTDAETRAAIMRFQEGNGLVPDGKVGPRTLAALDLGERGDPVALNKLLNDAGV